jgi:hypothetical protein
MVLADNHHPYDANGIIEHDVLMSQKTEHRTLQSNTYDTNGIIEHDMLMPQKTEHRTLQSNTFLLRVESKRRTRALAACLSHRTSASASSRQTLRWRSPWQPKAFQRCLHDQCVWQHE